MMKRGGMSTDTATFAALLNELRGPLTGVASVCTFSPYFSFVDNSRITIIQTDGWCCCVLQYSKIKISTLFRLNWRSGQDVCPPLLRLEIIFFVFQIFATSFFVIEMLGSDSEQIFGTWRFRYAWTTHPNACGRQTMYALTGKFFCVSTPLCAPCRRKCTPNLTMKRQEARPSRLRTFTSLNLASWRTGKAVNKSYLMAQRLFGQKCQIFRLAAF